jgi:hypothetical protein
MSTVRLQRLQALDKAVTAGTRLRVVYPDDQYDAECVSRDGDVVRLRFLEDDEVEEHKLSSLTYELITNTEDAQIDGGTAETGEGSDSRSALAASIFASAASSPTLTASQPTAAPRASSGMLPSGVASASPFSPQPKSKRRAATKGAQTKGPTPQAVARRRAVELAAQRKFREAHPECTFSPKLSDVNKSLLQNSEYLSLDFVERQRVEAAERERRRALRRREAERAAHDEAKGHRFEMSAKSRALVTRMGMARSAAGGALEGQRESESATQQSMGRSVRARRHGAAVAKATAEARARSNGGIVIALDGTPLSPGTMMPLFTPSTKHPQHGDLFQPSWSAAEDRHNVGVANGDICESLYRAGARQRGRREDSQAADTAVLRTLAQQRKMLPQSELIVARRFVEQARQCFGELVEAAKEQARLDAAEAGSEPSVFQSMMIDELTGAMVPRPDSITFADMAALLKAVGLIVEEEEDSFVLLELESGGSGGGGGDVPRAVNDARAKKARFYAHQRRLLLRLWAALAPGHPEAPLAEDGDPGSEVALSGGRGQGVECEPLIAFVEAVVLHRHEDEAVARGEGSAANDERGSAAQRWALLLSAFWRIHQRALRARLVEQTAARAPAGVIKSGTVSSATLAAYAEQTFAPLINPESARLAENQAQRLGTAGLSRTEVLHAQGRRMEADLERLRRQHARDELAECTFQPKLHKPRQREAKLRGVYSNARHAVAQMEAGRSGLRSTAVSGAADAVEVPSAADGASVSERLYSAAVKSQQKRAATAERAAAEAEEKDERECTFKPTFTTTPGRTRARGKKHGAAGRERARALPQRDPDARRRGSSILVASSSGAPVRGGAPVSRTPGSDALVATVADLSASSAKPLGYDRYVARMSRASAAKKARAEEKNLKLHNRGLAAKLPKSMLRNKSGRIVTKPFSIGRRGGAPKRSNPLAAGRSVRRAEGDATASAGVRARGRAEASHVRGAATADGRSVDSRVTSARASRAHSPTSVGPAAGWVRLSFLFARRLSSQRSHCAALRSQALAHPRSTIASHAQHACPINGCLPPLLSSLAGWRSGARRR